MCDSWLRLRVRGKERERVFESECEAVKIERSGKE